MNRKSKKQIESHQKDLITKWKINGDSIDLLTEDAVTILRPQSTYINKKNEQIFQKTKIQIFAAIE